MGILGNLSVYGLMIVPLAMLARGKNIVMSRLVLLGFVTMVLQFSESILVESTVALAGTDGSVGVWAEAAVRGALLPLVEAYFFSFVLTDGKAIRLLHLADAVDPSAAGSGGGAASAASPEDDSGDLSAAVAVVWCGCRVLFFRWIGWYRTMGSLGFEPANLRSGAEAFAQLLSTLAACRMLRSSGGATSTITTIVGAHAAAAAAGTVVDSLASRAVASAALYLVSCATSTAAAKAKTD